MSDAPARGQRLNYDLIADRYDEPSRDYTADPHLEQHIRAKPANEPPARVLDIGCGTGKQLAANRERSPGLALFGVDRFAGMLRQARRRCATAGWTQADGSALPFAADTFDYACNQFAYQHMVHRERMIAEAGRVLRRGGRFALFNIDPWAMPRWIVYRYFPAARDRDLHDFLPIEALTALLRSAGFRDVRVQRVPRASQVDLVEFQAYASARYRTSQLLVISDEDYHAGLEGITADLARGVQTVPSQINLIVIVAGKPSA